MARFCGKCGTRIEDGMTGCPKCFPSASDVKRTGLPPINNDGYTDDRNVKGNYGKNSILVSSDEYVREKITSSYGGSFIRGDGVSSSEAICTNRRFYFSGACYDGVGVMKKTKQEWMVDLEDITASGFKYSSNLFLLAMTVGMSLYFLINLFNGEVGLAIGFLLVTAIFAVLYYFSRKTLFVVTFAGGWIAVNASQYGVENAHRFNKVLRYEKEKRMEQLRR